MGKATFENVVPKQKHPDLHFQKSWVTYHLNQSEHGLLFCQVLRRSNIYQASQQKQICQKWMGILVKLQLFQVYGSDLYIS